MLKVVAKPSTMVVWEEIQRMSQILVCLMKKGESPPLSNEFPPETAHLLDSGVSHDFRVIRSLQTMRKDKSFKVWDHHGNDSNSLPCPGFRERGTGHGIPLKLAKASRPAGSPTQGQE